MELYKKIKARREELGMSQEELATKLGYKSRSTINKIEMGKNDITQSKIQAFADALCTTPGYLMGFDNDNNKGESEDVVSVPIVGEVAAGMGCYADNNIIGYMDIPDSWISGPEEHVLLKVSGDSMIPEFMEDDLVLIRCQTSVDSGSYAIAIIDDDNGVVKRVRYGSDWIELQSLNPVYAPRLFEGEDVSRVRIFGLVRKIIRNYD